jgi:aspartate aminotransferase
VFDGEHVSIAQAEPRLKDRTIVVNGFSKGYAMTGWRLGYLAATKEIVGAVGKLQSQETSAPSTISQKAGEAALRGSLDTVFAMRDAFKARRDFMVAALNAIPGVRCFNPGGAFYVFPDVSAYLGKKSPDGTVIATSSDLCFYLIEAAGIATVPGDAFGEPDGLRLSYACSMADLEESVKRLRQGLETLS